MGSLGSPGRPPAAGRVGRDQAPAGARVVLRGWGAVVAVPAAFVSFLNKLGYSWLETRLRDKCVGPNQAV